MTSERRSELSTEFVTVREWATVPLDMTAPLLAFTLGPDPADGDWRPTDWVGNSTVDDASGLNYRSHRILVGPGDAAAIALPPGRWLIWRQLADNPETVVDRVAGTLTIY